MRRKERLLSLEEPPPHPIPQRPQLQKLRATRRYQRGFEQLLQPAVAPGSVRRRLLPGYPPPVAASLLCLAADPLGGLRAAELELFDVPLAIERVVVDGQLRREQRAEVSVFVLLVQSVSHQKGVSLCTSSTKCIERHQCIESARALPAAR